MPTLRDSLDMAILFMRAEQTDSAVSLFREILEGLDRADSSLQAEALFGWASVLGQTEDSLAADQRVGWYLQASTLDSARFFVPATNDAAVVASKSGNHALSGQLYSRAGDVEHPAQSYILVDAAREFERAGQPDSARNAYQRAILADAKNLSALAGFNELVVMTGAYNSLFVLAIAAGRAVGSAGRDLIADALVDVIADSNASRSQVDSALVLFAQSVAQLGVGPGQFASSYRGRLETAVQYRSHRGIRQLVRGFGAPPAETAIPSWWSDGRWRWTSWSTTMRRLGDWHVDASQPEAARLYYLAALTYPDPRFAREPWPDLAALLPLARLYVDRGDYSEFRDWLFEGKSELYRTLSENPENIGILRQFHRTLGFMFALRKEWGRDSDDYSGAAYQLNRMRQFTREMQREGHDVEDPPELLEQLVYAYAEVGQEDLAVNLAPEVLEAYDARGSTQSASSFMSYLQRNLGW